MLVSIPFVDRRSELSYLIDLAYRGSIFPLFIYGPEGCGKTRLLRELIEVLKKDFVVIYVDAKEGSLDRVLKGSSSDVVGIAFEISSSMLEPIGKVLAKLIPRLVSLYEERYRFRGKKVIVLVDEVVEAIGLKSIESYAKVLHDIAIDIAERYRAESVAIIATTSEGSSREVLSRHSYLHLSYLWNLHREAFEELARALNSPSDLVEILYTYTSGNPRALIDIAYLGWRIDSWVEMIYREKILQLRYSKNVIEHLEDLEEVVENPDKALDIDPELRRLLIELNLLIYLGYPLTPETKPRPSRDLGIGEYFAWQLNIYRLLIRDRLLVSRS